MKIIGSAQDRVARALLEGGPISAAGLAVSLGLTQTAVRRQLDLLVAAGFAEPHGEAPYGPKSKAQRGRGRPARLFALTPAGRERFAGAYDSLAVDALRMLRERAGSEAVRDLARERLADVLPGVSNASLGDLVGQLTAAGYAAELRQAPVGDGQQLCQRNCPISHVATEFHEFCDVETEEISQRLGVHVTRLSTISNGSDICTMHVPTRRSE